MKLLFLQSNRAHKRNQLLLNELNRSLNVCITTYGEKDMPMSDVAVDITNKFNDALKKINPDMFLVRGDRHEMLGPTMLAAYSGIKIAHLEAFDLSGVIDNRVRFAISHLSDIHFTTNTDSHSRGIAMGFKNVYNYGSLDTEYALSVDVKPRGDDYVLALYHTVPGEDPQELTKALNRIELKILGVKGNNDYGKSTYTEEYSPEDFISLLKNASCIVGNSSAGLKEASCLGTPVVNIGDRQQNRLTPHNVVQVPCEHELILQAVKHQLNHGKYEQSDIYTQPYTSKKIAREIIRFL